MITNVIGIVAILLYGIAAWLLGRRLTTDTAGAWPRAVLLGPWLAALGLHAIVLYGVVIAGPGLNLPLVNALSIVGWLCALILLTATLARPVEGLGVILLPLAAVALAVGLAFPADRPVGIANGWALPVHVVLSMLAYTLLTVAAVQAIILAIQDRHIRSGRPTRLENTMPPLQAMEHLLFRMIAIGFVLLSLALVSGFLFLDDVFGQGLVHKTVLSVVAWVVFGSLLWGRVQFGWRGRVAVRYTLAGVVALMLGYFGSRFVIEFLLGR